MGGILGVQGHIDISNVYVNKNWLLRNFHPFFFSMNNFKYSSKHINNQILFEQVNYLLYQNHGIKTTINETNFMEA